MGIIVKVLVTIIGGYLLGSLSTSIFMSRSVLGGDVRKQGSGNAGATNMARIYGLGFGVLTLFGDMLKTVAAMYVGQLLLGDYGLALAGFSVLLGHCFPVFHHFHGGKGVATGAAIGLMVDWRVFVAIVIAFFVGALLTKKVSVGSICASVMIIISSLIVGVSVPKLILCILGVTLVIYQHRENIKRLKEGVEPDFRAAKHLPTIRKGKKNDVQRT